MTSTTPPAATAPILPSDQSSPPASAHPTLVPITYDLPAGTPTSSTLAARALSEQQQKLERRAARFGTPVTKSVNEAAVLGARRASLRSGFTSGFDPGAAEFADRRAARMKRFGAVNVEQGGAVGQEEELVERPVLAGHWLESRRDVGVGEMARPEALHVFGVDMMKTEDLMRYFREYGPAWVEWLNDSSCNVVFEDDFTVRRALRGVSVEDGTPEDVSGAANGASAELGDQFKWKKGKGMRNGKGVVPVWVRQATANDVRPEKPNPNSKWSKTMKIKRESIGKGMRERSAGSGAEARGTSRSPGGAVRPSRAGAVSLGVDRTSAIEKARRKVVTRNDLDKALGS
eukprot:GFKZ01011401.1.p1 GENE.GFKZ01011401.1~~GFKZ01011401.1.p1  ORF type:complete len:381 (-),score=66.85 GFKZ01011401.1:452-1486(-)